MSPRILASAGLAFAILLAVVTGFASWSMNRLTILLICEPPPPVSSVKFIRERGSESEASESRESRRFCISLDSR